MSAGPDGRPGPDPVPRSRARPEGPRWRVLRRATGLAAALVAGCAGGGLENEPEAFFDAYYDGCYTAMAEFTAESFYRHLARRDPARFSAADAYRRGWEFGYEDCRGKAESSGPT